MPQKYTPPFADRWIRHDWRQWIRPDIARWMKPGVDPADVIPALARERAQKEAARERARAAEDAELAAEIEHERRVLAALNEEMKEVNAEMARRRRRPAEEAKYSPSQPRIPKRNPGGGQWTRIGGSGQSPSSNIAKPMGNVDAGDLRRSSEVGDLFQIRPRDTRVEGIQVGGDIIRVCIASGISSWKDGLGVKNYKITYDCAGGRSFQRSYIGNYPGIVRDPNR
jgi:hypothetical protein